MTENANGSPQRASKTTYILIAVAILFVVALLLYLVPVSVNGQVSDAETGEHLPGVAVVLSTGETLTSDADGRFSFQSARTKSVTVDLDAAVYDLWQGAPRFAPLPLLPAQLGASLQPFVLAGQVTDGVTREPAPGITVRAGDQQAVTGADGSFELQRVPRDGALLTLEGEGFISREVDSSALAADEAALALFPNGVHGVVSDAGSGDPIAGAQLTLNGVAAESAADGFYYFAPVVGEGDLAVQAAGYLPGQANVAGDAALQGQTDIDITLKPVTLTGQVIDGQSGNPVAGATVQVADQTATSGVDGRYLLERLHGDGLTLAASHADYEDAEAPVDEASHLMGGQSLDITMLPPHLAGQVVNQVTGNPVVGATVTAGALSAETDDAGQFVLWTTETPLQITVAAPGYADAESQFSQDAPLEVALEPKGLVVTVVDGTGAPLAGAQVSSPGSEAVSDDQGLALLPLLEAGDEVTASLAGYAGASLLYDGAAQAEMALLPDTVAGQVVDAVSGEGVLGAIVYVYDRDACQDVACRGTDPLLVVDAEPDGSFAVAGLPENPQVMVKSPGYSLFFASDLQGGDCDAPYCLQTDLQPFEARGFYVPFHYLYDRGLINSRLDLIEQSDVLNAVVVDMKSDFGEIAWDPKNEIARDIGVYQEDVMTAQEFLAEARKRGIYTIARFVTFKDDALAKGRPEWAVRKKSEPDVLYRDGENLAWVDPYREEVQQYEIDLAVELAELGFDEIQFDYFRFDGGEALSFIGGAPSRFIFQVESTVDNRRETISNFAGKLMAALKPTGAFTGVDVFGNIILVGREPIIGQDLQEIAKNLDYLNPMIYPQVWGPETFTECGDPALCPYKVISDSTSIVRDIVPMPTRIRPWIQGYPNNYRSSGVAAGYNYAVPEMMIQRQAAEDAGAEGWLFWSGGGNFPSEIFGPLPSLAELEAQIRARQGGRSGPY